MKTMLNARQVPSNKPADFIRPDPLEPGAYPARLVQVLLLGTQEQRPFKGEEKPPSLEISLTYELLDEFMKDEDGNDILDKPRWLSERMSFKNLSADLATSTKRYYALDPEENYAGDWAELLGTPCIITVVVETWKDKKTGEDRFKEKITAVSAMRPKEAAKAPPLVNKPRVFDFYNPDMEVWDTLPQWLRDVMKAAVDFEGGELERVLDGRPEPSQKPSGDVLEDDLSEEELSRPTKGKKVVKADEEEDW